MIIIYDDGNYRPCSVRMAVALFDQGHHAHIRHPDQSSVPAGNSNRFWLHKSFAWFEMLANYKELSKKWPYGQRDKIIILDADMVIVGDISGLFSTTAPIALVPDHYDKWQAGVIVLNPSAFPDMERVGRELISMIPTCEWDKGDQTLLNLYLEQHPEIEVEPLDKAYSWCRPDGPRTLDTKILHFHGWPKPWQTGYKSSQHPYSYEAHPLQP